MSTELNKSIIMKEAYVYCLSQQLNEFEVLKSMYPNQGEIVLTDKNIIHNIEEFISNNCEYIPKHLDFTINLHISNSKLEICVSLPSSYPEEEPDIYIRCNQLNRQQESSLNSHLAEYIKSIHVGEVCLFSVITWLQENMDNYKMQNICTKALDDITQLDKNEDKYIRMWIFSHHIYNKKKREEIVKMAKDFKLTGFCLPGKPGVICVEGEDSHCQGWWRDIKSMSWKKIMVRKTETLKNLEEEKKFNSFEEIYFKNTTKTSHSNMSEFSKYMHEHGLTPIFHEFFGLSGE